MPTLSKVTMAADRFFSGTSPLHEALEAFRADCKQLGITFAVAGGLAVNAHGYRRTTEDIDILISAEDLDTFKSQKIGVGYVPKFEGSTGFKHAPSGTPFDVLISGEPANEHMPANLCIPHPSDVAEDGVVNLQTLLTMKIATAMTAPHRSNHDYADAQRLIEVNNLPASYGDGMDVFVHEKFLDLWKLAQVARERRR